MIGLGVAAALMAGLKAIVLWFPRERVALVNSYMIMLGALGAVKGEVCGCIARRGAADRGDRRAQAGLQS
jgi:hypothetical protein